MKVFLSSVSIMFSMFSRIPMPRVEWNKTNMRYVMCVLPLAGVMVGALVYGTNALAVYLGFGTFLRAALLTLVPVLITGGIHMDGFCDTVDAMASHAGQEKKLDILKDPNAGAFAVIGVCVYMLAYVAFWTQPLSQSAILCFCCSYILVRALGGIATAKFPLARNTGLAHTFSDGAAKQMTFGVLCGVAVLAAAGMIWINPFYGLGICLAQLGVFAYCRWGLVAQFGGITGDLVGWSMQMGEILSLAVLVLISGVMVL